MGQVTFDITNTSGNALRVRYADDSGATQEVEVAPGDVHSVAADDTQSVEVRALGVDNGQPEPGTDTRGA